MTGPVRQTTRWQQPLQWASRTLHTLLTVLGASSGAVSPLFDDDYLRANGDDLQIVFGKRLEIGPALLVVGVILVAVGTFWGASRDRKQERKIRSLEEAKNSLSEENERLRGEKAQLEDRYADTLAALSEIGNYAMIRLSKDLGLGNTERATLVIVEDDHFRQVGRYAHRPQYCEPGRGKYPLTHGCMGEAWTEGAAEVKNLPNPATDSVKYRRAVKARVGMAASDVRAQSMNSRCYAARRIEDASGETPLGVVVIESTRLRGVSLSQLNDYLDSGRRMLELAQMLRLLSQVKPEAAVAREAGF